MTVIVSRLVTHANRELDLIGYSKLPIANSMSTKFDPNVEMRRNVIDLVTMFAGQNHSGASAAYLTRMLTDLLQFKSLTPLTDKPEEWEHIPEVIAGDDKTWQNIRNSAAMSSNAGKTYYLVNEPDRGFKTLFSKLPYPLRSLVWNHFRGLIVVMHRSIQAR